MSPLDLSEFLAQDFTDIRLAIPSLKAAYFGDAFSVTGVVTVLPVETIIPTESSPWFVTPNLPTTVNLTLAGSNLPGFAFENFEPAIRLSYSGVDQAEFNLIYMYGFNRIPSFGRRVVGSRSGSLSVDVEIVPTYYRRHVIGLRWSTTVTDPWVVDSETKYESRLDVEVIPGIAEDGRSLSSNDLLSSTHHIQSMLGVERLFGDNFARVQLVGSLISPYDTAVIRDRFIPSITGYFRRSFSRETLNSYLADLQSIQRVGGFKAIGKLTVDMSDLNARLTTIASHLPKQSHWQALLILEDYLDSEEADALVGGLTEFPGSLDRVALALERLDDLVATERAMVLEAVRVEHLAAQEFVDETLTRTLEYLTRERLAILEAAQAERVAVLQEIHQERIDTIQVLQQERETILAELNATADRLADRSVNIMDRTIDHFFLRLIQILAVLLAVAGVVTLVALRFMTRRSAAA